MKYFGKLFFCHLFVPILIHIRNSYLSQNILHSILIIHHISPLSDFLLQKFHALPKVRTTWSTRITVVRTVTSSVRMVWLAVSTVPTVSSSIRRPLCVWNRPSWLLAMAVQRQPLKLLTPHHRMLRVGWRVNKFGTALNLAWKSFNSKLMHCKHLHSCSCIILIL